MGECKRMIDEGALILDVQDGPLRKEIPGTVNQSLGTLPFAADAAFAEGQFKTSRIADNKDQTIIVTCGLGGQAKLAAAILTGYGFKNVYAMDGGCQAWADADLEYN